jgi:Protein of unknown function (DUF1559)
MTSTYTKSIKIHRNWRDARCTNLWGERERRKRSSRTNRCAGWLYFALVVIQCVPLVVLLGCGTAATSEGIRKANEASRRNALFAIGEALHEYSLSNGTPCRDRLDNSRTSLLSWRVELLPYFGHGELYEKFHLDEPWDSPHNARLIEFMPEIYGDPSLTGQNEAALRRTRYVAINPENLSCDCRNPDFQKNPSPIVTIVGEREAVIWTRPDNKLAFTDKHGRLDGYPQFVLFSDGNVEAVKTR